MLNLYNWQIQLRKGLLEIVLLNFLQHSRAHGYDIVQTLKQLKGLTIREGNIYPILARLQTDGLVKSQTEQSQDGPPRKYFELTKLGKSTLAEMNDHWYQLTQSIQTIRKGAHL